MNYSAIGQKVKAKYPEYSNIPDEQLGVMTVKKYPEYMNLGQNALEKAISSDALPVIGAILGLGGGAILAPVTMGASLPFGGIAGYGGGKAMQESLKDLLGIQATPPREQLQQAMEGAAVAGSIGELGAMGRTLIKPQQTLGEVRNVSLGSKTISPETETQSMATLKNNPYYKYADQDVQQIAEDRLSSFLKQFINPQSPGQISSVYQELTPFEKASRAYGSNEQFAKGTELASRAIRSNVYEQSPWVAQKATDIMRILNASKPVIQKVLPWVAGGTGALGFGNYLLNKLGK